MTTLESRFHKQDIINSFNIYVDSEKASVLGHADSRGDDVNLHFEGQQVVAGDGESLRVSLQNFTMFNNLYMVDNTNRRFVLKTSIADSSFNDVIYLDLGNHVSVQTIADDFKSKISVQLTSRLQTAYPGITVSGVVTSPDMSSMGAKGNKLLEVALTFSQSIATFPVTIRIQCPDSVGESYQLLGGMRQDDPSDTTFNSLLVTTNSTTKMTINGFFPMQRMTDPYVYVRCDQGNNGLEMSVLDSARSKQNTDLINSNILAKVFKDIEFITYDSNTGNEYFMNIQQRKLSTLRLSLTDSKGRKLGRIDSQGTGAGLELSPGTFKSDSQSTLGNLFFTAVIRVDVVKSSDPHKLDSMPPTPKIPATKNQKTQFFAM